MLATNVWPLKYLLTHMHNKKLICIFDLKFSSTTNFNCLSINTHRLSLYLFWSTFKGLNLEIVEKCLLFVKFGLVELNLNFGISLLQSRGNSCLARHTPYFYSYSLL